MSKRSQHRLWGRIPRRVARCASPPYQRGCRKWLISGNAVGLVDWNQPRKLGGKVDKTVNIPGETVDLAWSPTQPGVLGIVSSTTVRSPLPPRILLHVLTVDENSQD